MNIYEAACIAITLLSRKVLGKFSLTKFKVFYKSKPPLNFLCYQTRHIQVKQI